MIYGLISVAAGAVCLFQNFKTVEIGPGFSVTCHHRCEDSGNIYIYLLSVIHRWKKYSFVIPAFVHSFHSFCMHACMCVCVRACMYVCVYVCMYMCVCMCACVYVCMYVCMLMCVCMYVCTYVCILFNINFISQHVPLQKAILHARVCLYLTYVICVYIYIYIYIYIYTHCRLFVPKHRSRPNARLFLPYVSACSVHATKCQSL